MNFFSKIKNKMNEKSLERQVHILVFQLLAFNTLCIISKGVQNAKKKDIFWKILSFTHPKFLIWTSTWGFNGKHTDCQWKHWLSCNNAKNIGFYAKKLQFCCQNPNIFLILVQIKAFLVSTVTCWCTNWNEQRTFPNIKQRN